MKRGIIAVLLFVICIGLLGCHSYRTQTSQIRNYDGSISTIYTEETIDRTEEYGALMGLVFFSTAIKVGGKALLKQQDINSRSNHRHYPKRCYPKRGYPKRGYHW